MFLLGTVLTASTQLYEYYKNNDRIGGVHTMNYNVHDNRVTPIHVYACIKDFMWTDDESELLLNVIYDYKVQQLLERNMQIY